MNRQPSTAALTIAGSDSGGGAGIQADLKTFEACGVYGASALTCVTAQNPRGVRAIESLPAEFVAQQIRAVCDAFPIRVAKTGMLYSADIIRAVAREDVRQGIEVLVVDPVMVTSGGDRLLQADAVESLRSDLLPQARVVTPNLHEAEILIDHPISSVEELAESAREIGERYDVGCVVKGGHLAGDEIVDVLYDEGESCTFRGKRVAANETHGAGCCFSAALCAWLARGALLREAVPQAKDYVSRAFELAAPVGSHLPLNFSAAAADD